MLRRQSARSSPAVDTPPVAARERRREAGAGGTYGGCRRRTPARSPDNDSRWPASRSRRPGRTAPDGWRVEPVAGGRGRTSAFGRSTWLRVASRFWACAENRRNVNFALAPLKVRAIQSRAKTPRIQGAKKKKRRCSSGYNRVCLSSPSITLIVAILFLGCLGALASWRD